MRLQEIYHKYENGTFFDFLTSLSDRGVKVASGMFGTVIVPENRPYAYKIWAEDAGYEQMLDTIKHSVGKPYESLFPKLYGKTKQIPVPFTRHEYFKTTKVNVQRIEKLIPADDHNIFDDIEVFGTIINAYDELIYEILSLNTEQRDILEEYLQSGVDDSENDIPVAVLRAMNLLNLATIDGLFPDAVDIHIGNFMFRKSANGYDLVLTDVFADVETPSILISNLSWDGTSLPQSQAEVDKEQGYEPDYESPNDKVASIERPTHIANVGNNFVKGVGKNIKKSEMVLNYIKTGDVSKISELISNGDISGYKAFKYLADNSMYHLDDPNGFATLLVSCIDELSPAEFKKYEYDLISTIIDSQDEYLLQEIPKWREWTNFWDEARNQDSPLLDLLDQEEDE